MVDEGTEVIVRAAAVAGLRLGAVAVVLPERAVAGWSGPRSMRRPAVMPAEQGMG